MHCEFRNENMLQVRFEDPRLENMKYISFLIVVDDAICKLFCFSLYKVSENKKVSAAVLMNTINDADIVFSKFSVDDDNEIKVSHNMVILPDNMVNSLLISGAIARMAKDIDNVYPIIESNLEG